MRAFSAYLFLVEASRANLDTASVSLSPSMKSRSHSNTVLKGWKCEVILLCLCPSCRQPPGLKMSSLCIGIPSFSHIT